jgi:anhydro-N-acetylmuramic acid kinase
MSGTSADGVDAALVRIDGRGVGMSAKLLSHCHIDYAPELRREIFRVRGGIELVRLSDLARMGRRISLVYVEAARQALKGAAVSASDVAAVAAHGQTLFHDPPDTVQWLDPALIASEVDCPVVSDFRRADCAAGGQGAPLVPFADYVLFRHPEKTRVLLNIGGIANFTYLRAGARIDEMFAFDTGPGNCVSDALVRSGEPQGMGVDIGGVRAGRGKVIPGVVDAILMDSYFAKNPPKSTDIPAMLALFDGACSAIAPDALIEDRLKTACQLTAMSIADAIKRSCDPLPDELIASGGGVHNATLMQLLREAIGNVPVMTIDELGIASEAKEAVAFALLGAATLDGEPSNVPSATGARRAVVLGSITPKP